VTRRLAFWFAFTGYFLTFLYYYGPHGISYSTFLYRILPFWVCILAIGGMPVPAVSLFIAPINAAIYGVAGALIGWILSKRLGKVRGNFGQVRSTPD
jgi:hypothetical protein